MQAALPVRSGHVVVDCLAATYALVVQAVPVAVVYGTWMIWSGADGTLNHQGPGAPDLDAELTRARYLA